MRIVGNWFLFEDGEHRPILRCKVQTGRGTTVAEQGSVSRLERMILTSDSRAVGFLPYFEKHIRPEPADARAGRYSAAVIKCHSAEARRCKAGLRLDSASAMLRGGDSGPLFEPGKPDDSLLIASLRWESYEMPPDAKLPDQVVEHFVRWIEMGAPGPAAREPAAEMPGTDSAAAQLTGRSSRRCWSIRRRSSR
jgi:hypothetical protein